jgi:RNA polymerase sigma-70 factor (ECF subfamily)
VTDIVAADALARELMVRSAASGDEVAFARLVAEHHASMARVAFVICGDADATRDAVQVAWSIAWRKIGSLRKPSRVRPWLVAIAANEARKVAGKRRRNGVTDISAALAARDAADPLEAVGLIDLRRALQRLRPEERELLAMRYAAGLDSNDIAEQLGLTASGVRSRLSRLVERLRVELAMEPEVVT